LKLVLVIAPSYKLGVSKLRMGIGAGNAPRRSRQDGSKDHSPTERWTDLSMKEQLSSGQESLSKWAGDIKRG